MGVPDAVKPAPRSRRPQPQPPLHPHRSDSPKPWVRGDIAHALGYLCDPGSTYELRVLNPEGAGVVSGYFKNFDKLADAAAEWSGRAPAVYITLNPVAPALVGRGPSNRAIIGARTTTRDRDIARRRRLLVDIDPTRPEKDTSSTDTEKARALEVAVRVRGYLAARGWLAPVLGDSGNGYHLVYAIDLPNDAEARWLVEGCLKVLDAMFSTHEVKVDTSVFNAGRISKLYGTMVCKGTHTSERPHRPSRIVEAPTTLQHVPKKALERLAVRRLDGMRPDANLIASVTTPFDVDRYLHEHGVSVKRSEAYDGGRRWILKVCPFNPEHGKRTDVAIFQTAAGAVSFCCKHAGCAGTTWNDFRNAVEQRQPPTAAPVVRSVSGESWPARQPLSASLSERAESSRALRVWPVLDPAAAYGLPGDFVRVIEPHSEADAAALLAQILVAFGNALNTGPHFRAEADRHAMNLYVVLVGETSKGRKGTAWGHVRRVYEPVDLEWTKRFMGGLSSGEGLIWAVRDPIFRWETTRRGKGEGPSDGEEVLVDPGVSDKRLLVVEAEFASVLKVMTREGNTLSPVLRLAWDGVTLRTLTKNSPASATGAHISIVGHATADELRRNLTATEAGNGFANRFLWIAVRRSKELPDGGAFHTVDVTPLVTRLREALAFGRTVAELRRDPAAALVWRGVYSDLSRGRPGLLGAVLSRAEAQVMRLACIYALADLSREVRLEHLTAALALWGYAEDSAEFIFGDALGDPVADEILRALRQAPEGLTRTGIRDLFQRHQSVGAIAVALSSLQERGLARVVEVETGGRPAERWYARSSGGDRSDQGDKTGGS